MLIDDARINRITGQIIGAAIEVHRVFGPVSECCCLHRCADRRRCRPNAPFLGAHRETPLHWAASSDDVGALDALVDGGANIEAPGSVIGDGTPLADAVAFGQWQAARRLIDREGGHHVR